MILGVQLYSLRTRLPILRALALSVAVGCAIRVGTTVSLESSPDAIVVRRITRFVMSWLEWLPDPLPIDIALQISDFVFLAPALIGSLITYRITAFRWLRDSFPRCGRCNQILRGITEPICPECGTPI